MKENLLTNALKDNAIQSLVADLDAGYGTYNEVNTIAEMLGEYVGREMSMVKYDPELLRNYLVDGHEVIAMLSETAQQNLNDAAKIGIKPLLTKTPNAQISRIVENISATGEELLLDKLQETVPSFMMKMVDDISKYNLDFQAKSGLAPIIRRTWSGSYGSHDTKHTDWCRDLEGEWTYGDEPKDVYKRHEGCRCKVEFFPNKAAEGRIAALSKGEVDREGVLWNTKQETLGQRIRNAERSKKHK